MELSKRAKFVVLALLLAILMIGGIGLIVSYVNKDDIKTNSENQLDVETTQAQSVSVRIPEGMEVKYIKDELISMPHIGRFSGEFVNYKGRSVLYYNQKLMDLQTGDTILELPESVFVDYVWGVYVDDDDQIYTISSKEAPGSLVLTQYTLEGEMVGESVELKDNSIKWFTGKDGEDENYIRLWYFSVDEDRIYLTTWSLDSIFQMFSRDGSLLFTQNTCYGTVLNKGKLYLAGMLGEGANTGYGVGLLDASTLEWEYVINIERYAFGLELDAENGILYAPTETGVNTYSAVDGRPLGEVFSVYQSGEMVASGPYLRGFAMDTDGNMYFRSWQTENKVCLASQYLCYDRTLTEKKEKTVTLTIYDNWCSEYIEELILRFEARYPEEKVEYSFENESAKSALSGAYHEKLAEILLAGNAADIVMLGGYLSVCTDVIKSDLLVDLTPYLQEDFDRTAYDETMLSALDLGGEVKAFPINFYMPFLQIDVKGLRELGVTTDFETMTWSELFSLADVVKEKAPDKVLFAVPYDDGYRDGLMLDILEQLLVVNLPELIDYEKGTVDLNQQWFVDLMKQFKMVSDYPNIAKYLPNGRFNPSAFWDFLQDQSYVRIDVGGEFYTSHGMDNVYRHYYPNQKPGADIRYYPIPSGEKGSNRAAYSWNLYGITEKSPNKDSAWKFLKFAIEEENQQLGSFVSLPVNKAAWSTMIPPVDMVPEEGIKPYFDDLTMLYKNIDTIYGSDKVTMDAFEPLLQYLNDELTLEEALAKAQQNVWIRINE